MNIVHKLIKLNWRRVVNRAVMTSRKAAVAVALLIPVLLGLSTVAYASLTATGVNPNDNYQPSNPHCDVTVTGENAHNNAIQSAINTAETPPPTRPYTICVDQGTYPEQLLITSSNIQLVGVSTHNDAQPLIQPTSVVPNSVDPATCSAGFCTFASCPTGSLVGTTTAGTTSTTLTDSALTLIANALVGDTLTYTSGTAAGHSQAITANTATTISTAAFSPGPAGSGDTFTVGVCSLESNIILVEGGATSITGVTISNLAVDGSLASSSFNSCAIGYDGVLFLNAGGTINGNTVQNVYLPATLAGCQPGLGIEVQTSTGLSSPVSISNNQVQNYNKNGITCNDAGTNCNISQNTVTFYSANIVGAPAVSYSQYIAPNGIQIGFGAVGAVSGNTVSGNECNLGYPSGICGPNYVTQTQSAGILTYESGKGTTVSGNTVSGNDIGILTAADAVTSTNNIVQDNRFEGMYLNDGTYTASNNQIACDHSATCDIGIAIVSDGYVSTPTTVTLSGNNFNGNNFNGKFSTAPVQAVAFTGAPNGGPNNEPAILNIDGLSETITAGSSATPSYVNITNFPSAGPFYP